LSLVTKVNIMGETSYLIVIASLHDKND